MAMRAKAICASSKLRTARSSAGGSWRSGALAKIAFVAITTGRFVFGVATKRFVIGRFVITGGGGITMFVEGADLTYLFVPSQFSRFVARAVSNVFVAFGFSFPAVGVDCEVFQRIH